MVLFGLMILFTIAYIVNYRITKLILPGKKGFLFAFVFLVLWIIEVQLGSLVFGSGYYGHQPKVVVDFFWLAVELYVYWYWALIVLLFVSAVWIRHITFQDQVQEIKE